MTSNLSVVVPNLLKAYDHPESSARKAAVFCLVAIHNIAGSENFNPYFKQLAGSKVRSISIPTPRYISLEAKIDNDPVLFK